MNIRASRGLYNGGSVPLGYKLIEDKPGYLAVDEGHAETIRVCFKSKSAHGRFRKIGYYEHGWARIVES